MQIDSVPICLTNAKTEVHSKASADRQKLRQGLLGSSLVGSLPCGGFDTIQNTHVIYCRFIFLFTIGGLTGIVLANFGLGYMILIMWLHISIMYFIWEPFFLYLQDFTIGSNPFLDHFFFGVNLAFFPMHFLGLSGMSRRIPDYPDAYARWNALSSFGSYISVVRIFCFFVVVTITSSSGKNKICAPSPWAVEHNPTTPEWMVQSPPAFHTFGELPAIKETNNYVKLLSLTSPILYRTNPNFLPLLSLLFGITKSTIFPFSLKSFLRFSTSPVSGNKKLSLGCEPHSFSLHLLSALAMNRYTCHSSLKAYGEKSVALTTLTPHLDAPPTIMDFMENVFPIVCEQAYTMAQNLDPKSDGRGVLQFKTGLMSVIKQKLAKKDGGQIDRNRDNELLWDFYNRYKRRHRVDDIQREEQKWRETGTFSAHIGDLEVRSSETERVFATLRALVEVMEILSKDVAPSGVGRLIMEELRRIKMSNATVSAAYNIVPLDAPSLTTAIGHFPEVRGAISAIRYTEHFPRLPADFESSG
ncbi:hypothetical protein ACS0TY_015635 [Phlomoides rotata]